MPNIGILRKKTLLGIFGKNLFVTVDGPPEKIKPYISLKFINFVLHWINKGGKNG